MSINLSHTAVEPDLSVVDLSIQRHPKSYGHHWLNATEAVAKPVFF